MNLRQIEVFRAVMQAGGISGAAQALHVSQPAVSRLIRYLEVKLRVTLFDRAGGRLQPTPEARALMREIDSAYRGIDRVRHCAAQLHRGANDTLRIASNMSTALDLVPRAVASLCAGMPAVRVSVDIATYAQITDQLLAGECDIGVAAFVQPQNPGLQAHPIGEGDVLCAMAAHHPLARRKRLRVEETRAYPVIAFGQETLQGKAVQALVGDAGPPMQGGIEVRYAYIACGIAAHGGGLALVDDLTASQFRRPDLALRPLASPSRYRAYALSSVQHPLSAAGRHMVDLLARHWDDARGQASAAKA
ncbi:MAG: LysR family transcriptional regulator [Rhodoferax sp.]|jgi:DNA-binding transcriptional LysR family regulator|nr:LysR family transcriptional regulator [Rhodoferax sp.]